MLRGLGADLNQCDALGIPPIHYLIYRNDKEDVRRFLELPDVNINAEDREGNTPLSLSLDIGNLEIAEMLRIKGARFSSKPAVNATCAYHVMMNPTVPDGTVRVALEQLFKDGLEASDETFLRDDRDAGIPFAELAMAAPRPNIVAWLRTLPSFLVPTHVIPGKIIPAVLQTDIIPPANLLDFRHCFAVRAAA